MSLRDIDLREIDLSIDLRINRGLISEIDTEIDSKIDRWDTIRDWSLRSLLSSIALSALARLRATEWSGDDAYVSCWEGDR